MIVYNMAYILISIKTLYTVEGVINISILNKVGGAKSIILKIMAVVNI